MAPLQYRFLQARCSGGLLAVVALGALAPASAQNADRDTLVVDGRMWSLEVSSEPVPWNDAREFCATLETAGHDDWRLPRLFELESLRDPASASGLPEPIALGDCCAWSADSLVDIAAEPKGGLPQPAGPPEQYFWAYLFSGAVRYYSNGRFPDGSALCLRDTEGD